MQGLKDLRESIALYLNKKSNNNFEADDILVGPGTKELMFLTHIAFNGGVIIPAPSWVSYEPQAIIGKNKVHWIETSSKTNWFPTATQIEEKWIIKKKNFKSIAVVKIPNKKIGYAINDRLKKASNKWRSK